MTPDRRTAAVATAAVPNREATTAPTDTFTLASASDERPRFTFSDMTNREFDIWWDGHLWGGAHEAERAKAAAAADFARMARRLRKTAGKPSHQELTEQRRRHQVEANRAQGCPWPQEVA